MDIEHFLDRESLTLATTNKRATAMGIDFMVMMLFIMAIDYESWQDIQTMQEALEWSSKITLSYMMIAVIYHAFFTTLYGATVGKILMKIRVISLYSGGTPNVAESINRSVVRIISESIFGLGFLWGLFDPYNQTWQDKTAKTLVIDA